MTVVIDKAEVTADHLPVWDDPAEALYRRVTIELEKCDGCRLCAVVCPANILEMFGPKDNLKVRLKADASGCMSCNNCFAVCASEGIYATEPYDFAGLYEQKRIGAFSAPRRF
ncbi:MAG TPA: 4Fe-4S dicluster domain-containing protein [Caulobacteraceae bacterium]|nr:4Fe-4S dicluster domain-containing protein [Caulobacteraceae bacterium]